MDRLGDSGDTPILGTISMVPSSASASRGGAVPSGLDSHTPGAAVGSPPPGGSTPGLAPEATATPHTDHHPEASDVIGEITGEIRGTISRSRGPSRGRDAGAPTGVDADLGDSGIVVGAPTESFSEIQMNAEIRGEIVRNGNGQAHVPRSRVVTRPPPRPHTPEVPAPRVPPEGENNTDRPPSPVKARGRTPSGRPRSTTCPSPELSNTLNKLGNISHLHNQLEEKVAALEEKVNGLLRFKASLPQNLGDTLKKIMATMDGLKNISGGDVSDQSLQLLRGMIEGLQQDIDSLTTSVDKMKEDGHGQQRSIEELFRITGNLQDGKADRSWTMSELDYKADKNMLDTKISQHTFDKHMEDIQKSLSDLFTKLGITEDSFREAMENMNKELDSKLDRMELNPLREYMENRLKALQKKLSKVGDVLGNEDADAAGIRKQLIQRFNCISCDNPVKMVSSAPVASLPQGEGMPPNRSPRPYTTYELEQIRQHQKNLQNGEYLDVYSQTRPCGGTHTMTFPHKRITKLTHLGQFVEERQEVVQTLPVTTLKDELDIQGVDGHIYRGRVDISRFPPVPDGQANHLPKMPARPSSTRGSSRTPAIHGGLARPATAGVVSNKDSQ